MIFGGILQSIVTRLYPVFPWFLAILIIFGIIAQFGNNTLAVLPNTVIVKAWQATDASRENNRRKTMYKSINITTEQINATGLDFGNRVEYTGDACKGQQGTITGFDGDFRQVMVYVKWDNPTEATSAACVRVDHLRKV